MTLTLENLVLWMPVIVIAVAAIFFAATILPRARTGTRNERSAMSAKPDAVHLQRIVNDLDRDARELRQISDHVEDARRALTTS